MLHTPGVVEASAWEGFGDAHLLLVATLRLNLLADRFELGSHDATHGGKNLYYSFGKILYTVYQIAGPNRFVSVAAL